MAAAKQLLAFDLGAESGRGILGRFDGQRLTLEVVHRFPNSAIRLPDGLYWDILGLYREMLAALRKCGSEHGGIDALGVDTWGVDFAFLGRGGSLLGNPRHYRDPHTETMMDDALARVPKLEVFRQTGVQFMRINSLYQLLAMQRDRSPLLDAAETLLMVPDLLNYFLTGVKVCEMSDASTSQMYNPTTKTWAFDLLKSFGLPTHIFGAIVQPGEVLGPLRPAVATEAGVKPVPVIAPGTHDTAAAVAAVPAASKSWAYISSGTWSLMGVELPAPLIDEKVLEYNFTNEGGVAGTIRFLKNIMGLWLVQECRRSWERAGKTWSYDELTRLAEAATPFASIVNPDNAAFLLPADMPRALADYCQRSGQPAPREPGAAIRCTLESLALRYRWVLERLEELTGNPLEVIHIVGGGSQNELLCQFTADACHRPVIAGPVEATAIGNLLVQAVGLKLLSSLSDARAVVSKSFDVKTYMPRNAPAWDEPYQRFLRCIA